MGPFKKLKAPPLANPKGEAELCSGDQQKVPRTPVGGLMRQPRASDGDIVKKIVQWRAIQNKTMNSYVIEITI